MRKQKFFLMEFTLAVLMLFQTSEGAIAHIRDKVSQGNNMNFTITPHRNGMWHSRAGGAVQTQWPKGSGNNYGGNQSYSGGGPISGAARDLDGDGTYEDTVFSTVRHGEIGGYLSTPSAQDLIETWYAAGNVMAIITRDVSYNRAYSTNDPNDYPDAWPVEFRDENGEPVTKGNETIVCRVSDTFTTGLRAGSAPMGVSVEAAHYFLSFGANKDIVYVDWKFQNMSEYCIYNDNPYYAAVSPPRGSTWMGAIVGYGLSRVYAGARDDVWGILSSKNLGAVYDNDGVEAWGESVALIGYKILRFPEFKGQQAKLLESATGWSAGFGTSNPNIDPMDYAEDHTQYRWFAHLQTAEGEQTGPYTPEIGGTIYGWPGVSYSPDEEYWDHWRFVGDKFYDMGTTTGFLDNVAPRDTFSMAVAVMFALPGGDGKLMLDPDYPNTRSMEAHMVPLEELSDYAQDAYDRGLQFPMPPVVPALTLIPGNEQVTITWSDINVTTPDPYYYYLQEKPEFDPNGQYREFDFQGYRVYRSTTWKVEDAQLLYEFDLDTGLSYSFVDNEVNNGVLYYYLVTAYDRNYLANTEFSLESRLVFTDDHRVVPRSGVDVDCALFGDVNFDGTVDITDVVAIVGFALGRTVPSALEFACADLNEDETVNIFDVLACVDQALGGALLLAGVMEQNLSQVDLEKLKLDLSTLGADQSLIEDIGELFSQTQGKPELPKAFSLGQNFPNPFNPSTAIIYSVPEGRTAKVSLRVYDVRGRLVRTLVNGMREPATHRVFWDGRDEAGSQVSSGIYIYRMQAGRFMQSRKMVLLK